MKQTMNQDKKEDVLKPPLTMTNTSLRNYKISRKLIFDT